MIRKFVSAPSLRLLVITLSALLPGTKSYAIDDSETSNDGDSFEWSIGSWTWGVPTLADTAYIFGGTVTVGGDIEVGRIRLTGGSLVGKVDAATDSLTLEGTGTNSVWSDGSIANLSLLIDDSNAGLDIKGASIHYYFGSTITNNGEVYWSEGNIATNASGAFINNGSFYDQTESDHSIDGAATFTNNGSYYKYGSATTTVNQAFDNDSAETLEVSDGVFILNGGGTNNDGAVMRVTYSGLIKFNDGYTIDNASDLEVGTSINENKLDGTHFFLLPDSEDTVDYGYTLSGGELNLSGNLEVNFQQTGGELDGTHTISGIYDWAGGDWDANGDEATTTIDAEGIVAIRPSGGAIAYFHNRDIINEGTIYWTDANLTTNANGSLANAGDFHDQNDQHRSFNGGSGFTNTGTYLKTGAGNTTFNVNFDNGEYGTLEVRAGTLTLDGGINSAASSSLTISSDAVVTINSESTLATGATVNGEGALELSGGALTADGTINANFKQSAGTLGGSPTFTKSFELTGGSLASETVIKLLENAQAVIDVSSLNLDDNVITVSEDAQLEWAGGTLSGHTANSGFRVEGGLMTATSDDLLTNDTAGAFLNITDGGVFRKTTGSGTTTLDAFLYVENSRFEVHAGTVELSGGGGFKGVVFDTWAGANLNFTNPSAIYVFSDENSIFQNGGNVNFMAGTFSSNSQHLNVGPHATLSGGQLSGNYGFSLSGHLTVTDGDLDLSHPLIASDGALILANPRSNILDGQYSVEGKIDWSDGDITIPDEGGDKLTIESSGEFVIQTDGTLTGGEIINEGRFAKIDGDGTTTINAPVTNNGSVESQSGILHFANSFDFAGGNLALDGGQITFAHPVSLPASAKLGGSGTLTGNFTVAGTVAPGNSIGALAITGDLTLLSSSTSFFEIDAGDSTSSADLVSVTGTLTLNGSLSLEFLSSVDPISTDSFTLYHANSLTGSFSNIASGDRLFATDNQGSFVVNYGSDSLFDPNSVILSDFTFTPVPEPSTWALMMTGLVMIGWRLQRRPRRRL